MYSAATTHQSANLGDVLGIIAIVVAVIAILVGVLAARRWGTKKRRLLVTYSASPLIPSLPSEAHETVQVTYKDIPVENPHLLEISIQNIGPVDVTTDDFDARRHAVFKLNCKIYGLVSSTRPGFTSCSPVGSEGLIEISPLLLKCKESCEITAITSGMPDVEPDFPLINTEIVDRPTLAAELTHSVIGQVLLAVTAALPGGQLAGAAAEALLSSRTKDV
jgi:hypothetical protein